MEDQQPYSAFDGGASSNFLQLDGCEFKKLARKLSISLVFLIFLLPIFFTEYLNLPNLPNFAAHMAIGSILGTLELPFCFTSLTFCKKMQGYVSIFEVYWLRGVFYIIIGVVLGLINQFMTPTELSLYTVMAWCFAIMSVLCGAIYVLASLNGECTAATGDLDAQGYAQQRLDVMRSSAGAVSDRLMGVLGGGEGRVTDIEKQAARAAMSTTL